MMKRYWSVALIIMAGVFSGCATRRQVAEMNLQVIEVRREHQQVMAQLARLDSLMREQSETAKRSNADIKLSMSAIEERMQMVESSLSDAGAMVNKAVETMEAKKPRSEPADSADTTGSAGEMDHLKVYKLAYQDVTRGNYSLAVKGFEEYLKIYPTTSLADNAVYWIGECHYIQKDYAKAQQWYTKLIDEYPKSEHLASAKLKLGMSLYNQRYITKAKQYFEDVVKDFPGTDQANQAADMLQRYRR
jgi:tol-pal system protein YbgF